MRFVPDWISDLVPGYNIGFNVSVSRERAERSLFVVLAKLLFLALLATFAVLAIALFSMTVAGIVGALLASFLVGIMLREILPVEWIRGKLGALWSGEAGEWAYDRVAAARSWTWAWIDRLLLFWR